MSARRSALGKGLGALIPSADSSAARAPAPPPPAPEAAPRDSATDSATHSARTEPAGPAQLPVGEIDPNPEQPRRVFDPVQLQELASSIARHGVIQPVVVRRSGARYELIVGERRWRATRAAGLPTIPAVIADIEPKNRLDLAIIENVQRHDLNPIELAHAYRALADSGATQEEIGQRVSKDRSSVANHLRLLELARDIQEDVESNRISMGHAKALLQVSNPERRRLLRDRIVEQKLSVRDAEQLGRDIAGPAKQRPPRKSSKPPVALDPALQSLAETLQRRLQTRVRIVGAADQGKIEIEYYEKEDLERLTSLFLDGY
ncbi:MAG: ParB/RepB/Spo0J family partition protein [Deltaproteobacteria bacterium]|nr:ParB/RepB/Spo0J family partition protein [Deltaproteobacteria bacterium]MBW2421404.1 ParB/RepB/Spo0J family partition protein [Deltaproteobacteria bacterium]